MVFKMLDVKAIKLLQVKFFLRMSEKNLLHDIDIKSACL